MNDCLTIDFEIIFNEELLDFEITNDSSLLFEVDNYSSLLPYYEGDYEVVPRKINQELNTRNKSLNDNITIDAIRM